MREQRETPLYATVFYEIRKQLGITWNEYIYLDMVYHLSKDGWCYKSIDNCGEDLGLNRSNVFRMRQRLISKGLLKKSIKGYVKTTEMYAKRIRTNNDPYAKRNQPYAKRIQTRMRNATQELPIRITKNNIKISPKEFLKQNDPGVYRKIYKA